MEKINKKPIAFPIFCLMAALVFLLSSCSSGSDYADPTNDSGSSIVSQTAETAGNTEITGNIAVSSDTAATGISGTCQRNKNCSYPGDCKMYTDSNNNNLCDLGE